jgi:hypothetical protein
MIRPRFRGATLKIKSGSPTVTSRLGYQSAIWAIAHRLFFVLWKIWHEGVRFIEQGSEPDPQTEKPRARIFARALRKPGHNVAISP